MDPDKMKLIEEEMSRFEAEIANTSAAPPAAPGVSRSAAPSSSLAPPRPPPPPSIFMPPQIRRGSVMAPPPPPQPRMGMSHMLPTPPPPMQPRYVMHGMSDSTGSTFMSPPVPVTTAPGKAVYSAAPQINHEALQSNARLMSQSSRPSTSAPVVPVPVPMPSVAEMMASDASAARVSAAVSAASTANSANAAVNQGKQKRFIRCAGGEIWNDPSLQEWDPNDFRMFCGDLGNEVSDEVLTRIFNRYQSFTKAKVVRSKRTGKSKGYGFVSFSDPADFTRAMREMNGKYVGNRPIKLKRSDWKNRQIDVVKKKQKEKRRFGLKF